jgi:hypothetical protein
VLHRGDVAAQAEVIYGNVIAVIAEAGGSAGNLVQTIEYTTPAAQARYREVAGVRTRLLEQTLPGFDQADLRGVVAPGDADRGRCARGAGSMMSGLIREALSVMPRPIQWAKIVTPALSRGPLAEAASSVDRQWIPAKGRDDAENVGGGWTLVQTR